MKNLILLFALVLSIASCTKEAQPSPMGKGKPIHNGGGGSNTVPQVTGLSATQTASGVQLQWNAVPNATTYWIYRDQYVPAIIAGTNYTDGTVAVGTHVYAIAAVVNSVLGPKSNPVTITVVP